mmetsp:Transcript_3574/g.7413  ORF Transcript_3574/g.7413 Transcript_3574/m.7413 type:complete len:91 (+) Transcript_3574:280-552(+)
MHGGWSQTEEEAGWQEKPSTSVFFLQLLNKDMHAESYEENDSQKHRNIIGPGQFKFRLFGIGFCVDIGTNRHWNTRKSSGARLGNPTHCC